MSAGIYEITGDAYFVQNLPGGLTVNAGSPASDAPSSKNQPNFVAQSNKVTRTARIEWYGYDYSKLTTIGDGANITNEKNSGNANLMNTF